ncbi:AgmX/PglI C-terminal domain-containing protein [Pendulispora albinea]|uniref:AgmX/PglI C-terminal domain-containing protein n=1 Tax=Pendulispora albinea TaxID=2741071 RepID=A0ABZ2M4W6_9BACT
MKARLYSGRGGRAGIASVLIALSSCALAACGGSSSSPPAAPEGDKHETAGEPAAPATASASDPTDAGAPTSATSAPAPAAGTGTGDAAGTVSSGSDMPDECSKSALPFEEKVRPLFNKCYQEGKKKNPELSGTVRVSVSVNTVGKVTSVKPTGTSELGDSVVQCMVKAVRDTPFDGAACKSKSVIVSKTYGNK